MKKIKSIILSIVLAVVFALSFAGCTSGNNKLSDENVASSNQLTEEQKLDDFEYMYDVLKGNYPYFDVNKRMNGVDWLSKKNEYISEVKSSHDDLSFFNTLQSILGELNNGHTGMYNKENYIYSKTICSKYAKICEAWLKQLNDPKAAARYSALSDSQNESQTSSQNIIKGNVKTAILEKEKTVYLAIHSFNSLNIDEDMKTIKPFLKNIKNYKAFIIDIRGNGGGDSRYWSDNIVPMLINKPIDDTDYCAYRGGSFTEQFIKCRHGFGYEKLEKVSDIAKENLKNLPPEIEKDFKYYRKDKSCYEPKDSVGFKGRIYLLVDGDVFSSSEKFAAFAKSTGFATLAGEKTGGDGIGDDPALCVLPNSGYVFSFTEEMGLTSDGACNFEHKTEPDIKVSAKVNPDFSHDEAIQAVLKLVH